MDSTNDAQIPTTDSSASTPSAPAPTFPLRPIKGTHDLLPPHSLRAARLSLLLSSLASRHSFLPIRTPILEPAALILRSLPSSDITLKELFSFTDHGQPTVLRPEGTAPVARALIHRGGAAGVERLYYEGPMFRRERPQRGRYRQFTQFGVEVVGEAGVAGEVDCIGLAWEVMREAGLDGEVQLQLNSLGDEDSRRGYCAALQAFLAGHSARLSLDSARRLDAAHVLRVLDSKDERDRQVVEGEGTPRLYDHLSAACRRRFDAVQSALTALSIPFVVNPFLVRGLDYYTHTAFEILPAASTTASAPSAQSTILAGGRYDGLFALLGGKDEARQWGGLWASSGCC